MGDERDQGCVNGMTIETECNDDDNLEKIWIKGCKIVIKHTLNNIRLTENISYINK